MSLDVSVFLAYSNYAHDTRYLRRTLEGLDNQTHRPREILLGDESEPKDRYEIIDLCDEFGVTYIQFPFTNFAPAISRIYNGLFQISVGDAILLLCSSWQLAPNWIEEMARWLEELGPGNLVTTDNDRHSLPIGEVKCDWHEGKGDRFLSEHHSEIDNVKCMFHRQDFIPFDQDFDPIVGDLSATCGNMHGLIFWAFLQTTLMRRKLWVRRDLDMEHANIPHTPERDRIAQHMIRWSDRIYQWKVATHNAQMFQADDSIPKDVTPMCWEDEPELVAPSGTFFPKVASRGAWR